MDSHQQEAARPNIPIRLGEMKDAEAYHTFRQKIPYETVFMAWKPGEFDLPQQNTEARLQSQQQGQRQTQNTNVAFLAWDGPKVVGAVAAERGRPERMKHRAHLAIGVLAAYRGMGVGSRLLKALEDWAKEQGVIRLELTVMTANHLAHTLYGKMGYKEEGIRRKAIFSEGQYLDEYYMAKML